MNPILQLDQPLINKIAAGEVVERPLSVVKELLENAIDAGASTITIEITEGGLTSIRVTDNGGGIPSDQILLAFARHATSKIASIDDLFEVGTLGFRGEALSSIAAVSQVEMITKTTGAVMGTRVEIHGGQMISRQDIGTPGGTTVIVNNLFYNTPARRKFLKKPATEAGMIADSLQKLALGNPGLTIRFINNGQMAFQTNGRGDLKTAMLSVYGHEVAVKLVPVDAAQETIRLFGLVGKPEIARGNRQRQSFFINGRLIVSKILTQAVEEATRTMLPGGKFPMYVLNLVVPHDAVDVNVHPTKMDVRFADEDEIFAFIRGAVREALTESNLIPEVRFGGRKESRGVEELEQIRLGVAGHALLMPNAPREDVYRATDHGLSVSSIPGKDESHATDHGLHMPHSSMKDERRATGHGLLMPNSPGKDESRSVGADLVSARACDNNNTTEKANDPAKSSFSGQTQGLPLQHTNRYPLQNLLSPKEIASNTDYRPTALREDIPTAPQPFFTAYTIIGLVFGTYWLIAQDDSLYLVDQHAAHERVMYEEILAQTSVSAIDSQPLLTPEPLRLTPLETSLLKDNLPLFNRFGFEIGGLEQNKPAITAVPFLIKGPTPTSFFTEILDKLGQSSFSRSGVYAHKTETIAMAACKAAVKAGDSLTETEARALVKKMLTLENPFTCPHGRPTIIEITKRELEKRFKRG